MNSTWSHSVTVLAKKRGGEMIWTNSNIIDSEVHMTGICGQHWGRPTSNNGLVKAEKKEEM